jgi:hypothetical protein
VKNRAIIIIIIIIIIICLYYRDMKNKTTNLHYHMLLGATDVIDTRPLVREGAPHQENSSGQ